MAADNFYVDELWRVMLGGPSQALSMNTGTLYDHLHPDDRGARARVIQVLKGQLPRLDVDYRLRLQNGGCLWCQGNGEVLERDAAGRALRVVGTQGE